MSYIGVDTNPVVTTMVASVGYNPRTTTIVAAVGSQPRSHYICKFTSDYKDICLDTSKCNEKICSLTKHMNHTIQQNYVDDNKTFYNKYSCR